eukprot:COSAG02_NODE_22872_length_737_cov_1.302508_1_plen_103_part_01
MGRLDCGNSACPFRHHQPHSSANNRSVVQHSRLQRQHNCSPRPNECLRRFDARTDPVGISIYQRCRSQLERTLQSRLRHVYSEDEMLGQRLVVVSNLKPRKLM